MITPVFLEKGDTIGIVATGKNIEAGKLKPALKCLRDQGYVLKLADNLPVSYHQFAGTDCTRASSFQDLLDDPGVKAILCARGGYGTLRIMDRLDFTNFERKPKWVAGFSDITVLHAYLNTRLGVETIHGTMPINFPADGSVNDSVGQLLAVLSGKMPSYTLPPVDLNRHGSATGKLVGGNLSVLYSINNTPYDIDTTNAILFLEDLDEYLYHLDRMLVNLKLSGKLRNVKGVIAGHFTGIKDNHTPFGKAAWEIVLDAFEGMGIPVAFGFPAGHEEPNLPLVMGRDIILEVGDKGTRIEFKTC